MRVFIRWRVDTEEYYTTDSSECIYGDWWDVFDAVEQIEACGCTVLEITNKIN